MSGEQIFLEDWIREADYYFSGRDRELLRIFQKEWYDGSGDNPMLFPIKQTSPAWREHFEWFLTVSNFAIPAPKITPFPKPEERYDISEDPGTIFIDHDQGVFEIVNPVRDGEEPVPPEVETPESASSTAPSNVFRDKTGTIVMDRTDLEDSGDLDDLDSLILEAAKIKQKLKESEVNSTTVDTRTMIIDQNDPYPGSGPEEPGSSLLEPEGLTRINQREKEPPEDQEDRLAQPPGLPVNTESEPELELDDLNSLIIEAEQAKAEQEKAAAKNRKTGTPPGVGPSVRMKSKQGPDRPAPPDSGAPALKHALPPEKTTGLNNRPRSGQGARPEEPGTILLDSSQKIGTVEPKARPAAPGKPGPGLKSEGRPLARSKQGPIRPFPQKTVKIPPVESDGPVSDKKPAESRTTPAGQKQHGTPEKKTEVRNKTHDNLELDLDDLQTMEWLDE